MSENSFPSSNLPPKVAAAAAAVANAGANLGAPISPTPQAKPAGARIMIVDDEPVNIKVVRKYLQIAGYENFITTSESPQAMAMVRKEKPDVILLDVMM